MRCCYLYERGRPAEGRGQAGVGKEGPWVVEVPALGADFESGPGRGIRIGFSSRADVVGLTYAAYSEVVDT